MSQLWQPNQRQSAVFLDRDGTIIEEVGYLREPAEVQLVPESIPALRLLQQHFALVIVTNQAGIARGYLNESRLHQIHEHLKVRLTQVGIHLAAIYYCPHHPKAGHLPYQRKCQCRKPQPGMLLHAAHDLTLDLPTSYTIGDKLSDVGAGKNAGTHTILVRTGYGRKHEHLLASASIFPDHVADDLWDAATWIMRNDGLVRPSSPIPFEIQ